MAEWKSIPCWPNYIASDEGEIAEELRKKHDIELYKECLDVGTRIYEMTKQ